MEKEKKNTTENDIGNNLTNAILSEMVNNLEDTKLKLLLNVKELKEKLNQQKEDQADIYYYLNKKCDESFEVIASLEEQILTEQADREIAEKMYENRIEDLKITSQQTENKFLSKITDLEKKIESLQNFSQQKNDMEENLNSLMRTLENERERFRKNAEDMENQFLMDRERLRKSYDNKFETIKRELESSIDGKLSKKTKNIQITNILIKKELDDQ
jgi:hypothetical protein